MGKPPLGARDATELAIVGAEKACQRANSARGDYEAANIAIGEALFWLCSADDALRERQGKQIYDPERAADPYGQQLLGLRHVRNSVAHAPIVVAHDGSKPFLVADWDENIHGPKKGLFFISPPFVWPDAAVLPARKEQNPNKPNPFWTACKQMFDRELAGKNCNVAISAGLDWCWWKLGLWEGSDAVTESTQGGNYDRRRCPDCDGKLQRRDYGDETSTPGRHTFWCVTDGCWRNALPALNPVAR